MVVLAAIALLGLAEPDPQAMRVPSTLDWNTFEQVRAYVEPRASQVAYQQLKWHSTVFDGIDDARKQDKPLLLWMYFGDPRGQC